MKNAIAMKVVIAPNAFKESMSSVEAASVMGEAVRGSCFQDVEVVPIGDGGDGTLEALEKVVDGRIVEVEVHDPIGNRIKAPLLVWEGGKKAFVEMARASGLALVPPEMRNPILTSSIGTGELIRKAAELGVEEVILGVGGSATVDGGLGALSALGFRFMDEKGKEIPPNGSGLLVLQKIIPPEKLPPVRIRIMADVRNPLLGEHGAARVYGPQKGATPSDVIALEKGLQRLAEIIRSLTGVEVSTVEGGGAAGGIAASFHGLMGATIENGGELFLELIDFDSKLEGARLVLTGEGKLDRQTAYGKGVAAVASHAAAKDIPVVAFAGIVTDRDELHRIGITAAFSILNAPMSVNEAIAYGKSLLYTAVREAVGLFCVAKEK